MALVKERVPALLISIWLGVQGFTKTISSSFLGIGQLYDPKFCFGKSLRILVEYLQNFSFILLEVNLILCLLLLSADSNQMSFADSLDPDQAQNNVWPDLDPNCLTL